MDRRISFISIATSLAIISMCLLVNGLAHATAASSAHSLRDTTSDFSSPVKPMLPATSLSGQLAWAEQEFTYVIDSKNYTATVYLTAHSTDAITIEASLPFLQAADANAASAPAPSFDTSDFLTITADTTTVAADQVGIVSLVFTLTNRLPHPGTYNGVLQVEASNADPITRTLTFIIPAALIRGDYRLAAAQLGQASTISPSLVLTTSPALQFTGTRWLPGSINVIPEWPIVVGVLLLAITFSVVIGYVIWMSSEYKVEASGNILLVILAALVMAGLVILILFSLIPNSTHASLVPRTLLLWEAEGRGPVRDITIHGQEVASAIGHTGQISIAPTQTRQAIPPGGILTVPINIDGLSSPGVYLGQFLIQSPDLAQGVVRIPLQVIVHDFILWPILVILLGVIVGSYARYQQEINSQRMEKRRQLEKAWQEWDDYMRSDRYLYPQPNDDVGEINPLYANIQFVLARVQRLLTIAPEWGISDADQAVGLVREQMTTYRRLSDLMAAWRAELDTVSGKREAQPWIERTERALRCGELPDAAMFAGKLLRATLPVIIEDLRKVVKDTGIEPEAQKPLNVLLDAAQKLCALGIFGEALLKVLAAEHALGQLGVTAALSTSVAQPLPPIAATSIPKMSAFTTPKPYRICKVIELDSYRGDTVRFEVVHNGNPKAYDCQWEVVKGEAMVLEPLRGAVGAIRFFEAGTWTIQAKVQPTLLFALKREQEIIDKLDQQTDVPTVMAEKFLEQGYALVSAKVTKNGDEWTIDNGAQKYLIRNEQNDLNVYAPDVETPISQNFEVKDCTYEMRKVFPIARSFAEDTFLFEVVRLDANKRRVDLPEDAQYVWTFEHWGKPQTETNTRFRLPKEFVSLGKWEVNVEVQVHRQSSWVNMGTTEKLSLDLKESALVEIYKDKRRQNFYRSMIALLLALVGGVLAQRVFNLTFGSFEEYLLAFAWGAGVNAGVEAVANLPTSFGALLGYFFPT